MIEVFGIQEHLLSSHTAVKQQLDELCLRLKVF